MLSISVFVINKRTYSLHFKFLIMGNTETKKKAQKFYEKVLNEENPNDDIRKILLYHEKAHPNSKLSKLEFSILYEEFKRSEYKYKPITNMYFLISLEKISEFVFRSKKMLLLLLNIFMLNKFFLSI